MQFNNTPPKSATAFAHSGSKNTIPEASQIGITPGAASFTDGFPPLTMTPVAAGGVPPYGQDFNGILHFLSNAVRWAQMGAGYPFDAAFATAIGGYPKGAVVRSNDGLTLWLSTTDQNTTDPNAGASPKWQSIAQPSTVVAGKYGSVTMVPIITVDSTGRITNIEQQLIQAGLPYANAVPTTNIGDTIFVKGMGEMEWVSTPYYTGYRSPLCGRPVDGHTVVPLASEIDAVGGLLSKTAYAGLWGYAQENNLVVTQGDWAANIGAHWFVDVSNTQFRVPDLRNQFRRYTGTDADNANERGLGSRQKDALQNITGKLFVRPHLGAIPGAVFGGQGAFESEQKTGVTGASTMELSDSTNVSDKTTFDASRVARTSSETRAANTAYAPRIHV